MSDNAVTTVPAKVAASSVANPVAGGKLAWGLRGGLALLDQAFFAGTHFVINVLLARWLSPQEYGAFAVAYSAYLLLDATYHPFVSEPVLTFGAGEFGGRFRAYMSVVLKLHAAITMSGCIVIALTAALFVSDRVLRMTLLAMAVAAPFVLLLWLVRRARFVQMQPQQACAASGLYCFIVMSSATILKAGGQLSNVSMFLVMAAAAAVASLIQLHGLRPAFERVQGKIELRSVVRRHWTYGRWVLGSMTLSSLALNCYFFFLPVRWGLEASGGLKALMNLLYPIIHAMIGFSSLMIPIFAVSARELGSTGLHREVRRALALFVPLSLVFLLALGTFRIEVLALLYRGAYRDYADLPLLLIGISIVPMVGTAIIGCALRAMNETARLFYPFAAGGLATLAIGLPLAAAYGVAGASGGLLVSQLATGVFMWVLYRKSMRERGCHAG